MNVFKYLKKYSPLEILSGKENPSSFSNSISQDMNQVTLIAR